MDIYMITSGKDANRKKKQFNLMQSNFALIRNGRIQIDSLTFSRKTDHRRFATKRITSPMPAVIAKPGFIPPMNFCPLFFFTFALIAEYSSLSYFSTAFGFCS
jgi:hypothetical protein